MLHVHRLSQGQIQSSLLTSFLFKFPFALVEVCFSQLPAIYMSFFFPLQTQPCSEGKARFFPSNTSLTGREISASEDMQELLLCKHYWPLTQGEIPLVPTLKVKKGEIQEHLLIISVCADWLGN